MTAGPGRAEVEAVGDRQRLGAGSRDVAVRLGQGQLRARIRVEGGEARIAVGGERDTESRVARRRSIPASSGWARTELPRT